MIETTTVTHSHSCLELSLSGSPFQGRLIQYNAFIDFDIKQLNLKSMAIAEKWIKHISNTIRKCLGKWYILRTDLFSRVPLWTLARHYQSPPSRFAWRRQCSEPGNDSRRLQRHRPPLGGAVEAAANRLTLRSWSVLMLDLFDGVELREVDTDDGQPADIVQVQGLAANGDESHRWSIVSLTVESRT